MNSELRARARRCRFVLAACWFVGFGSLAGCGLNTGAGPLPTVHLEIAVASGDEQSAAPGEKLREPLVVLVRNQFGFPVAGVAVSFEVTQGGGIATVGTRTSTDGRVETQLTLGPDVGPNTVVASVADVASLSVTFTENAVAPATRSLAAGGLPATMTAGVPGNFTVTARDASGRTNGLYRGTVKLTSTDPGAVLPASYTFGASDAGSHTFPVALGSAGTWSVTATDTRDPGLTATQYGIKVVGKPKKLLLTGLPGSVGAGSVSSVTLTVVDSAGVVVTGYAGTISFSSTDADPGVVLPSAYTFTAADAGAHSFPASVVLETFGPEIVTASDASAGITGSATVTVRTKGFVFASASGTPDPAHGHSHVHVNVAGCPDGGSVVAGSFWGYSTDDPTISFGSSSFSLSSLAFVYRSYLVRYKADGSVAWASVPTTDSTGSVSHAALCVLASGSTVVLGTGSGFPIDFGSSKTLKGSGLYAATYDESGACLSAMFLSSSYFVPTSIAALPSGGFALTAQYYGPATLGSISLPSSGFSYHALIAKLDAAFTPVWAVTGDDATGDTFLTPASISGATDDLIVAAGTFTGYGGAPALTFGTTTISGALYVPTTYLVGCKSDGTIAFVKTATGTCDLTSTAVTPTGKVLATGSITDAVTFGPGEPGAATVGVAGSTSFFVASFATDGALSWVKTTSYSGSSSTFFDAATGIACADDGSFAVTGNFTTGTLTFWDGVGVTTTIPAGSYFPQTSVFLASFKADGTAKWAKASKLVDFPDFDYLIAPSCSVSFCGDGGIVIAGKYGQGFSFGTTTPELELGTGEPTVTDLPFSPSTATSADESFCAKWFDY
ncbi:hypothetical protein HY251_07395 [bacterium]|nr:hypothetical protein [bacterium]